MTNETAKGRIFHITAYKCGSQWVRDVLRAPGVIDGSGYRHVAPPQRTVDPGQWWSTIPPDSFCSPVYFLNAFEWNALRQPGDRAIVVLRDPRDCLVSQMYSWLYSHGHTPLVDLARDTLFALTGSERRLKVLFLFGNELWMRFFASWAIDESNAVLVRRYEDLVADQNGRFAEIVDWLGWPSGREALATAVDRLSFESRSGRKPGETDVLSHYRRGVAGDWRNHFTRSLGELWERIAPGLLTSIGYEASDDWWRDLPERLTGDESPAESPEQERIQAMDRRIVMLEKDLAEKESEIRSLNKAANERLDVIHKLTRALSQRDGTVQSDLARMQAELINKNAVITELSRAVVAYRLALPILRPLLFVINPARRLVRGLTPRLGRLNHHPPRPLHPIQPVESSVPETKLPSIAVVTPCFQQGRYLERTLLSVLGQGYPRLRYHVQDGGSTDETVSILERYAGRLTDWDSRPDDGQSHAINLGFARTTGEIMCWLNSDDLFLPGALHAVGEYFARHPEVDVLYGNRILIDDDDREIGRWVLPPHDDAVLSWADFIPQETLFWRRELWERTGGHVDEAFRFAMDWDLLLRFRDAGARMVRIPRFLGAFRVHEAQKTTAEIGDVGFKEMERLRARVHGREVDRLEIRKAIAPYLARHVLHHVGHSLRDRLQNLQKSSIAST